MKKFDNMEEFGQAVTDVSKESNLGKGIVAQLEENEKPFIYQNMKITKGMMERVYEDVFENNNKN